MLVEIYMQQLVYCNSYEMYLKLLFGLFFILRKSTSSKVNEKKPEKYISENQYVCVTLFENRQIFDFEFHFTFIDI